MKIQGPTFDVVNIAVVAALIVTVVADAYHSDANLKKQEEALKLAQDQLQLAQAQLDTAEKIRVAQIRPWVGRVHYSLELQIATYSNGTTIEGGEYIRFLKNMEYLVALSLTILQYPLRRWLKSSGNSILTN